MFDCRGCGKTFSLKVQNETGAAASRGSTSYLITLVKAAQYQRGVNWQRADPGQRKRQRWEASRHRATEERLRVNGCRFGSSAVCLSLTGWQGSSNSASLFSPLKPASFSHSQHAPTPLATHLARASPRRTMAPDSREIINLKLNAIQRCRALATKPFFFFQTAVSKKKKKIKSLHEDK